MSEQNKQLQQQIQTPLVVNNSNETVGADSPVSNYKLWLGGIAAMIAVSSYLFGINFSSQRMRNRLPTWISIGLVRK